MKKDIVKTITVESCENVDKFTNKIQKIKSKLKKLGYKKIVVSGFYQNDEDETDNSFYLNICGTRKETTKEYKKRLEKEATGKDTKKILKQIKSVPQNLEKVIFSISKEIKLLISEKSVRPSIQLDLEIQNKCNLLEVIRNKKTKFENVIESKNNELILGLEKDLTNSYDIKGY